MTSSRRARTAWHVERAGDRLGGARDPRAPRRQPRPAAAATWRACRRRTSTRRRRDGARRSRPPAPPRRARPATISPAGPAPITTTSSTRWLMAWHPDGMGRIVAVPLAAAVAVVSACGGSSGDAKTMSGTAAQTVPATSGASRALHLVQVGTFDSPVYVTSPPGDARRLLVVEQGGTIRMVRGGKKLAKPFLDIRSRVVSGGEQGLLSIAFARDYARSHRFWAYFTTATATRRSTRSARPRAIARTPARRSASSSRPTPSPTTTAGSCSWVPTATSTPAWATAAARTTSTARAATGRTSARCWARSSASSPAPAAATPSPRATRSSGRAGARGAIYSYGLRNPWRFSFDRATGDIVIGDVGQNAIEEIDFRKRGTARGVNFGWRPWEGRRRNFNEPALGAVFPQITKSHSDGWCSITGGYVVRDHALGSLYGRYVYGDYCKGQIRAVKLSQSRATRRHGAGAEDRPRDLVVRPGRARAHLRRVAQRAGLPLRALKAAIASAPRATASAPGRGARRAARRRPARGRARPRRHRAGRRRRRRCRPAGGLRRTAPRSSTAWPCRNGHRRVHGGQTAAEQRQVLRRARDVGHDEVERGRARGRAGHGAAAGSGQQVGGLGQRP